MTDKSKNSYSILSDVAALRAAWAKGDEASLAPVIEALKATAPLERAELNSKSAGPKK